MKKYKKVFLIALALILVSIAAFFTLKGITPAKIDTPTVSNSNQSAPDVNVNGIAPNATITLPEISAHPSSDSSSDVIDPAKKDTDVTVPLTDPVTKPAEAETNKHEKAETKEPPKPTTPPAASAPKATAPPKSNEPKSGDANDKGQVWVPGFGWVTPGNGNQGGKSGSDGDINKQVGDM